MKHVTVKTFLPVFLCILALLALEVEAANRWSYNNGGVIGWSSTDPGLGAPTNCSCTPAQNDNITITNTGLTVSLGAWNIGQGGSSTVTVMSGGILTFTGNMEVRNGSTLIIQGGGTLNATNMTVAGGSPGGIFTLSTGATANVSGNFTNNNNSDGVTINGQMTVSGNLTNGNGSEIVGTGGITVGGTITNNGTIGGSTNDDLGTLPVELTSFEVERITDGLKLQWQTATELNNDYFDVERSEDGTNFYKVGRIIGKGTTDQVQQYTFTDKAPIAHVEYYRLKQVDFDGAFEYSKVIVGYADKLQRDLRLTTYPNPVIDRLTIESVAPISFKQLQLFNISGQKVADLLPLIQGSGLMLTIELPALEKGIYYMHFQLADGVSGSKKLLMK